MGATASPTVQYGKGLTVDGRGGGLVPIVTQFLVFFTENEDHQILQLGYSWPPKNSASITPKQKYFMTN